jgi:hypothetical protein
MSRGLSVHGVPVRMVFYAAPWVYSIRRGVLWVVTFLILEDSSKITIVGFSKYLSRND